MLLILMPRINDAIFIEIDSGFKKNYIRGSGNLPYLVANTHGLNFIKIGGIWIFRVAEAPIRGFTKIRGWKSGNLPYLVANTYGLNFIKIGGMSTFHSGQGEPPAPIVPLTKN